MSWAPVVSAPPKAPPSFYNCISAHVIPPSTAITTRHPDLPATAFIGSTVVRV